MRLRAFLLLLASFSCWTDEIVLLIAPSLSQECIDSTEDDEAIVARSARQQLCHLQVTSPAKIYSTLQRIRQFKSFASTGQDECLVLLERLYQLMSLRL